ncbi:MAG: hypothetical protein ABSH51_31080, partial [Solirubrobacteraceae bacterium]
MSAAEIRWASSAGPRSGAGEGADEDRQSERTADLVKDVGDATGRPRIPGLDAGDAGCRQRAEDAARSGADQCHRQPDP